MRFMIICYRAAAMRTTSTPEQRYLFMRAVRLAVMARRAEGRT